MSEKLIYDVTGKARFGSRPRPWLARYVLELPSNEAFYGQGFRHTLGSELVHVYGLAMPDINIAIKEFRAAGMIAPISPADQLKQEFVGVINRGWTPYAEFLGQHLVSQGLAEEAPVFHLTPGE